MKKRVVRFNFRSMNKVQKQDFMIHWLFEEMQNEFNRRFPDSKTNAAFAKFIGVNKSMITHWRSGDRGISFETFLVAVKKFGWELDFSEASPDST